MLSALSNNALIEKLKSFKSKENETIAEITLYLSELDERKLYRDLGYSSLFSYCTEGLLYSESAAYRRIQAARMLKTNPDIYDSIKEGKLSLCAVAEIARVKEEADKRELLKASEGKSRKEVQVLTAKYQAPEKPRKETIRAKNVANEPDLFSQIPEKKVRESFTISIEVEKDFMELLSEVKAIVGYMPTSEVFRKTMKEFLDRRNAIKRRVEPKASRNTRFIPKALKLEVINRDNRQCSYVSADGRRCTEKHRLEIDHIKPYAMGGENHSDNLRLLCKSHNLLMAERVFGKEKIVKFA